MSGQWAHTAHSTQYIAVSLTQHLHRAFVVVAVLASPCADGACRLTSRPSRLLLLLKVIIKVVTTIHKFKGCRQGRYYNTQIERLSSRSLLQYTNWNCVMFNTISTMNSLITTTLIWFGSWRISYFSGIRHGQIIVIRYKSSERLVCDQKYSLVKHVVHCI